MVVFLQDLGEYAVLGNLSTFPMQTKKVFKWQADALYKQLSEKQRMLYNSVMLCSDKENILRVYGDYLPERRRFDKLYIETNRGRVIEFHYTTYVDADFYLMYLPKDIEDGSKLKLQCCDYLQLMNESIGNFIMADPVNKAVLVSGRYDSSSSRNGYNIIYSTGPFYNYNVTNSKFKCVVDRKSGFPMLFVLSDTGHWERATFKCNSPGTSGVMLANIGREMADVQKRLGGFKRVVQACMSSTDSLIDALKSINFPTVETSNLDSMYAVAKEMGEYHNLELLIALCENEKWIVKDNKDKTAVLYTYKRDIGAYIELYRSVYSNFVDNLSLFGESKVQFKAIVSKDGKFYGVTRDTLAELHNTKVTYIDLTDMQFLVKGSLCCVYWRTVGIGAESITVRYGDFDYTMHGMMVYRLNLAKLKYNSLELSAITLNSTSEKSTTGCQISCECIGLTGEFISKLTKATVSGSINCDIVLSIEQMLKDGTLLQSMQILSEYFIKETSGGFNWRFFVFIREHFEVLGAKISEGDLGEYMQGHILMNYLSVSAWDSFIGDLTAVVEDSSMNENERLKRALWCFQIYHLEYANAVR